MNFCVVACMHQSIQMGGYYILKYPNRGQYDTEVSNKMKHGKICIAPEMTFWTLSFAFGETMHHTGPSQTHPSGVSSFSVSGTSVGDKSQNNVIFQETTSQMHRNSDIHVHIFSERSDIFSTFPQPDEVLSMSSCVRIMKAEAGRTSSAVDPQYGDVPQGNLVSFYGNIEKIQIFNYDPRPFVTSEHSDSFYTDQRMGFNTVIHIYDDDNKVISFLLSYRCLYMACNCITH